MKALLTRLTGALTATLCLPLPALALSCMPYDIVSAYKDAEKSDDSFVVVLGDLTFDKSALPVVDMDHQADTPADTFFQGRLVGNALTLDGFETPFEMDIAINVQCFGPWCGSLTPDTEYLGFLKRTEGGLLLETNPCGGYAFGEPQPEDVAKVLACARGESCTPPLH